MPMGLQAGSAIFQRNMDVLLTGLQPDVAISFIDDVLIFGGETVEEHLANVVKVLDRVGGAGYTFRPDKCFFAFESINFLGSRIERGTIRPDDEKVAQLRDAEFPATKELLQKWIGLVQWCSPHIPGCAFELGPLSARASAGATGPPTQQELECFEKLKKWLTDPQGPVIFLPDFEKPFYLLCDAANTVGLGVCLCQIDDQGHERVVAFYSRRWQDAERRWHSLEHECCTVYEAVKRFATYLGEKFYIITDAEPLVWLNSIKQPRGKYATWAMELAAYDYEIAHRPGRLHKLVDTVSRLSASLPDPEPRGLVSNIIGGTMVQPPGGGVSACAREGDTKIS